MSGVSLAQISHIRIATDNVQQKLKGFAVNTKAVVGWLPIDASPQICSQSNLIYLFILQNRHKVIYFCNLEVSPEKSGVRRVAGRA